MIDSFYIAWKYVVYYKVKTITLVACITLITCLPFSLELLLRESEHQLMSRAASTPLVIGAKGSALDLLMNTLYFGEEEPEQISMEASARITESGLAMPIPLHVRFRARGLPIVGTAFEYFEFRGLQIGQGRPLALLGECVLGASAAKKLELKPGDSIVSSPEDLFALAGTYPLKMKIVGVFEHNFTSDDHAVFVDLKTSWVIQGLGHGHQDMTKVSDASVVLKRDQGNVTANAKLLHFNEITEDNINSFHFHGDTGEYPATAVIVVPHSEKSGTILQGRYLSDKEQNQIVQPGKVIDGLLQTIFRIKRIIDAVIFVVAIATMLAIILVFVLSLRLRQRELQTIFRLGCSRMTTARLVAAEIAIIVLASSVLCALLVFSTSMFATDLVRALFIS